ncbi:MAG: GNAT family N-acetyltransferase [Spirochaetota bacterium]|nr:GNAT family N-acetyltransferase [Spirochaetota bacterium]
MISTYEQVIPLNQSQKRPAVKVLTRAYSDDALVNYIIPKASMKENQLSWYWGTALHSGLGYGMVFTTPDVNGVAIWSKPGNPKLTILDMFRVGMLTAPFKLGLASALRAKASMNYTTKIEKESAPEDHWHLLVLAVDPPCQGKGIGGMLIQPVLDQADADGYSCYLETFNENAVSFYEKHGFEVACITEVPKGGPQFWSMLRPPH